MGAVKRLVRWTSNLPPLFNVKIGVRSPLMTSLQIIATSAKLHVRRKLRLGRRPPVQQSFLGFTVQAFSLDSLIFLFDEIFVRNEYYVYTSNLERKNPVILDIGGNIGMATLYFKLLFPESSVFTFEPDPSTFRLLERNITENRLTNTEAFNVAVSNREGEIPFYKARNEPGSPAMSTRADRMQDRNRDADRISVKAVQLSAFLREHHIDSVDILKMDTEGSEWDVIEDMIGSGAIDRVDRILLEYHHCIAGEGSRLGKFLNLLEAQNFEYKLHASFLPVTREDKSQDVLVYFYRKR